MLASEEAVKEHNLKPLARVVGFSVVGVEPSIMGIGPSPAIKNLLKATGKTLNDIDLIDVSFRGMIIKTSGIEKHFDTFLYFWPQRLLFRRSFLQRSNSLTCKLFIGGKSGWEPNLANTVSVEAIRSVIHVFLAVF